MMKVAKVLWLMVSLMASVNAATTTSKKTTTTCDSSKCENKCCSNGKCGSKTDCELAQTVVVPVVVGIVVLLAIFATYVVCRSCRSSAATSVRPHITPGQGTPSARQGPDFAPLTTNSQSPMLAPQYPTPMQQPYQLQSNQPPMQMLTPQPYTETSYRQGGFPEPQGVPNQYPMQQPQVIYTTQVSPLSSHPQPPSGQPLVIIQQQQLAQPAYY